MLASLLPGLRDVRTPLTVGYMWLTALWMIAADKFSELSQSSGPHIERLLDATSSLGYGAIAGVVSFAAYLVGILLTARPGNRVVSRMSATYLRWTKWTLSDLTTEVDYTDFLRVNFVEADKILAKARDYDPEDFSIAHRVTHGRIERMANSDNERDLRGRLLVANQELYGEYDRLSSEGSFRVNIAIPLTALVTVASLDVGPWLIPFGFAAAISLLLSGLYRVDEAKITIHRAILSGVFTHPIVDSVAQFASEVDEYVATPRSPSPRSERR